MAEARAFTEAQREAITAKRLAVGRELEVTTRSTRGGLIAIMKWRYQGQRREQWVYPDGHRGPMMGAEKTYV